MARPSSLRALAERRSIVAQYEDVRGTAHRIDDATCVALLAAMGVDASTERAAREALAELDAEERARLLPAATVVEQRRRGRPEVVVHLPEQSGVVRWEAELEREDGERFERSGRGVARGGRLRLRLPWAPGLGYHRLHLQLGGREGDTRLIVVPSTCWTVREALGRRRVFGLWANLYALRSDANWGIGDLGDLRELGRWAAESGAAFVGINPLHALWNRGHDVSPYSPVSRLYRNPVYLDVPALPELARAPDTAASLTSPELRCALRELRETDAVDYERVWAVKRSVLQRLRAELVASGDPLAPDEQAYRRYLAEQGDALRDFATFLVLDAHHTRDGHPIWWREWPEPYRRPDSPEVAEFRRAHAAEIDFHCWCQFALDRQLGEVQAACRRAGMPIGLYQDLAVGSSAGGANAWVYQALFVSGATVGAPPDAYSASGQDWGLPPIDPHRLAASGFEYWIRLLRAAMSHAGALRMDHAMGMRRLFWVPAGRSARAGAYVEYPERELLGILALESRRHQALVVAEDLGTVPRGFPATLARRGILSSRVLYFERDRRGRFRPATAYSDRALVTTTTHDHAPVPAYWEGRDLELRHSLGLLGARELARARRERVQERSALLARLRADGLLARGAEPESPAAVTALVHRMLARTPAPLLGLSVDDLAGETRPVNVPGVGPDRYPSWTRKQRLSIEELQRDPDAREAVRAASARAWRRR